MTGFGRGIAASNYAQITVEARAVNHRFLELSLKFPKEYMEAEMKAKKMISAYMSRGKIDIYVSIQSLNDAEKKVHLNWPLFEAFEQAKNQIAAKVPLQQWTMAELLNIDQMLIIEEDKIPVEQIEDLIFDATKQAVEQLITMREREGQELKLVMVQLTNQLQSEMETIRLHSQDAVSKYRQRLLERLMEVSQSDDVDARLLTEVALYAEKVDITEELDRMKSHIAQMFDSLEETESIGRKLDFLMQEMHREINTIGSKNQSTTCSKAIVQAKMILEKLREQVQNIE
jgi:uncharacterized protein (TIGR00255 family)